MCFSQRKEACSPPPMLLVQITEYSVFLLWPVQAELYPPAESITLFVMALLVTVLLETKLH